MRLASLLFLACSLCLHGQAPALARPEPSLACLVPRVELGTIIKGRKVTHAFRLENRSRAPLNILGVNASCDCTTAPRNGLASGCYPLDAYYKNLPDGQLLREIKQTTRRLVE